MRIGGLDVPLTLELKAAVLAFSSIRKVHDKIRSEKTREQLKKLPRPNPERKRTQKED
jgi:hypothetical protein